MTENFTIWVIYEEHWKLWQGWIIWRCRWSRGLRPFYTTLSPLPAPTCRVSTCWNLVETDYFVVSLQSYCSARNFSFSIEKENTNFSRFASIWRWRAAVNGSCVGVLGRDDSRRQSWQKTSGKSTISRPYVDRETVEVAQIASNRVGAQFPHLSPK